MPVPLIGLAATAGRVAGTKAATKMGAGAVGQKIGGNVGANIGRTAALKMGMNHDAGRESSPVNQPAPSFNMRSIAGY